MVHDIPPQLLLSVAGKLGSQQEREELMAEFQASYVSPRQIQMEAVINDLLGARGFEEDVVISSFSEDGGIYSAVLTTGDITSFYTIEFIDETPRITAVEYNDSHGASHNITVNPDGTEVDNISYIVMDGEEEIASINLTATLDAEGALTPREWAITVNGVGGPGMVREFSHFRYQIVDGIVIFSFSDGYSYDQNNPITFSNIGTIIQNIRTLDNDLIDLAREHFVSR